MITSYKEYIGRYLLPSGLNGEKSPGEHHFVATYLVPKLFSINQTVPDYINPDGTKQKIGDIVYFKEGKHHFGIEVKIETIRLTKNEFNSWIVNENTIDHPDIFIGIDTAGIIILPWGEFRNAYLSSVGISEPQPIVKKNEYGPLKRINKLFAEGKDGAGYLPNVESDDEGKQYELDFELLLRSAIDK